MVYYYACRSCGERFLTTSRQLVCQSCGDPLRSARGFASKPSP